MEENNQKLLEKYFLKYRTMLITRKIGFQDGIMFLSRLQIYSQEAENLIVDKMFYSIPYTETILWREIFMALMETIVFYALTLKLPYEENKLEKDLLHFIEEESLKPKIIIKKPERWN
jgi:hypothetical protein